MAACHLNIIILPELGGYQRQDGWRAEGGGNAPSWHLQQVCGRAGVRASAPDPSADMAGGHVQQHPSPRLRQFAPGCAVRREHRRPSPRRLSELDVQQTSPGERRSPLQQRILHPERLPPVARLQQRTGQRAARRVPKLTPQHLQPVSSSPDVWVFSANAFRHETISQTERPAITQADYDRIKNRQMFCRKFIYADTYMNKAP